MKQRGFSLIVVMMLLTIMVGLSATALRTAAVDARVSGNERDRQLAFEAAEAALRDGEHWLKLELPIAARFDSACTQGLCLPSTNGLPRWRQVDWSGPVPIGYGHGAAAYPQSGLARAPRYLVEILPPLNNGTPYRITAAGWGRNLSSEVRLQSVFLAGEGTAARRLSWRQER